MATLWTVLATIIVAALAITASVHAIMTRREVGTAVAWVGVIWLSPVVGPVLYFLLGINRIRRRARELRLERSAGHPELPAIDRPSLDVVVGNRATHLEPLVTLGDSIVGRPLVPGNRFDPLEGGDEAFPAMIEAIEDARLSISLMTYIFDNDRAGRRFVEALARAVDRGVEVRILVDDVGARYSFPSIIRTLRRAGVRTARFMPAVFHWRMPYFNLRNHRKIMVVDGRLGFTGGMNIREQFWTEVVGEHHGSDLHFRAAGPVVAELQATFAHDWQFTTGERLEGAIWFPEVQPAGRTLARGISDGPDVDFEKLHTLIVGAISTARESVEVMTPYLIPDTRLLSTLTIAARRGVEVTLVLPEHINLILVKWASRAYWQELLEAGCRIVLTPPPFDHSKLLLVDGAWALVGSANLDPRSLQLNFEFNVECFDEDLVGRLRATLRRRVEAGRYISAAEAAARPFHLRFRDRLARLLSPYL